MSVKTLEEIDLEIAKKKRELESVEGSPCEVYTRIVGYYRSLKNWNPGKREEYRHRVLFDDGVAVPETLEKPVSGLSQGAERRSTFIPEKAGLSSVVAQFGELRV